MKVRTAYFGNGEQLDVLVPDDSGPTLVEACELGDHEATIEVTDERDSRMTPNSPKTPGRSIRVPEELWEEAKAVAAERGETVTEVVLRALRRYVSRQQRGR